MRGLNPSATAAPQEGYQAEAVKGCRIASHFAKLDILVNYYASRWSSTDGHPERNEQAEIVHHRTAEALRGLCSSVVREGEGACAGSLFYIVLLARNGSKNNKGAHAARGSRRVEKRCLLDTSRS